MSEPACCLYPNVYLGDSNSLCLVARWSAGVHLLCMQLARHKAHNWCSFLPLLSVSLYCQIINKPVYKTRAVFMVLIIVCVRVCVCVLIKSPLNRPIRSLIHMDRPVKIWHVSDTCRPRAKWKLPETSIEINLDCLIKIQIWHVAWWVGFINGVNQSALDTCHRGHVAARCQMETSRNPHQKWLWAVWSKSSHYGPSDQNPILPRGLPRTQHTA
jgi:hypothetical protein